MNSYKRRFYFLGLFGFLLLVGFGTYGLLLPEEPAAGYPAVAGHAGRLSGLAGMILLGGTLLLGSRPGYLERFLGLETMLRLHRPMGLATTLCLLAHALLMTSRHAVLAGQSWPEVLSTDAQLPEMLLGQVGLALILLAALAALLGKVRLLGYGVWKKLHVLVYPGVSLGMLHALFRGAQMDSPVFLALWLVTLACLLAGFTRRFLLVLGRRNWLPYRVAMVRPEGKDMASISFMPAEAERTLGSIRPGQFALLRIRTKSGWSEPHPFSIVSVPDEETVCLSVKRTGSFTDGVHALRPEDTVLMSGPYGIFCADALEQPRLCLIAGGVGITPFLSLLRTIRSLEKKPQVCLIWSVRAYDQAFALEELRQLRKEIPLELIVTCSREFGERLIALGDTDIRLEAGRINATHLRLCVLRGSSVYCCGPAEMQKTILAMFRDMGIKLGEVRRESFNW